MEFESTEIIAQVYETLKNINLAITRLQDRSVGINSVNDYLMSPNHRDRFVPVIPRPHDQPGYFCTIPRHKVTFRKKMQKFLVLKKKIHIFVANYV